VNMTAEAKRQGRSERRLSGGLEVLLVWVGGYKTLALRRDGRKPDDDDYSMCRLAFDVPSSARRANGDTTVMLRWLS
jgi:hypothetical protein